MTGDRTKNANDSTSFILVFVVLPFFTIIVINFNVDPFNMGAYNKKLLSKTRQKPQFIDSSNLTSFKITAASRTNG
jgi:hypothetical protein